MADEKMINNNTAEFDWWPISEPGMQLTLFSQYLTQMESFLESETQKHYESLEQKRATGQIYIDPETGSELDYDSDMIGLLLSFGETLRSSLFVSIYSFLEHTLLEECSSQKQRNDKIERA